MTREELLATLTVERFGNAKVLMKEAKAKPENDPAVVLARLRTLAQQEE